MSVAGTGERIKIPLGRAIELAGKAKLSGKSLQEEVIADRLVQRGRYFQPSKGSLQDFVIWLNTPLTEHEARHKLLQTNMINRTSKYFWDDACHCAGGKCNRCRATECADRGWKEREVYA